MAQVTIKLAPQAIERQLTGPSGAIAKDLVRRGQRVKNAARRNCPVDEGRLRASIDSEVRGSGRSLTVRIGSNLAHAIYVEKGTGVYAGRGYIYPKRGRYLRWPNKNNSGSGNRRYKSGKTSQFVFAKKIKGMKAQPFLEPALDAARG